MSIGSITGANSSGSSLNNTRSTIAGNFDTFLGILTTQLKNQNPLEPMDTNQFTQQLVQFSTVEQQLKTNEFMEALVLSNKMSTTNQAVSYIGKEVTASSTMTELRDGKAVWHYDLAEDATNATIIVKDANGNEVYSRSAPMESGEGRFVWDGRATNGELKPDGPYQIKIEAVNENGDVIATNVEMAGTVEGVDFSGDEPFLKIGGSLISLNSVISVNSIPSDGDGGETDTGEA